jgi:hypothetical protein
MHFAKIDSYDLCTLVIALKETYKKSYLTLFSAKRFFRTKIFPIGKGRGN